MLRSLIAKIDVAQMLKAQAISADTNSSSVDVADIGALMMLLNVGTFAFDGSNKVAVKVEHSDDNSAWAAVGASDLHNPEDGANGIQKILDAGTDGDQTYKIHYLGNKRYVRLVLDVTGTVSCSMSADAVKGHLEASV